MNQNNKRGLYIYLAILMAVVFLAMSWFNSTAAKKEVEYNQIVAEFLTDQVGEYRLDLNTRTLTYTLWKDMESKPPPAENASPESSSGASSSEAANPLTPFQPQPAQPKAKTYQVPSTDLFIRDVHNHVLEYNAAHPDKPVTMVYVPSVSTFAISRLLGGGTQMMLGDLIEQQFLGGAYNPHLGAAISMVMMVVVVLCMVAMNHFGEGEEQAVML